jgi:hypothetical protein
MAGRFEGLSDLEWKLFEDIFPKQASKRGKGMPIWINKILLVG